MSRKFYRNIHTREVKEIVKTETTKKGAKVHLLDDGSMWKDEQLNKHYFCVDKIAKDVWDLKRNKGETDVKV